MIVNLTAKIHFRAIQPIERSAITIGIPAVAIFTQV